MGVHGHPVAASDAPLGTIHDGITATNTSLDTLNATQTDALTTLGALQTLLGGTGSLGLTSAAVTALQNAFTTSLATNHTDLTTIASDLADIHAELIQKFESGDLVGMSQATLDGIGTAIATLFHYPTDYPSAGANTKLDTLHTDLGTLATSAAQTTANTKLDTVHTDLGHLTDNTQTTKITNGTQIADTVAGGTPDSGVGQNAVLTAFAQKEVAISFSGTATANTTISGPHDVSNYNSATLYVSVQTGGGYNLLGSVDGTNYKNLPAEDVSAGSTVISAVLGNYGTGVVGPLAFNLSAFRYVKVMVTSGSVTAMTGTLQLSAAPHVPRLISIQGAGSAPAVSQSGTWTVSALGPVPTTSLSAVSATGAGTAVNVGGMSKCQTLQVTVGGTGALSALTVVLEGSLDGTNWVTLATHTGTSGTGQVYSTNQSVSRIRANCTVRTASSGTPTITAIVGAAS